jgi:hypothetical protein
MEDEAGDPVDGLEASGNKDSLARDMCYSYLGLASKVVSRRQVIFCPAAESSRPGRTPWTTALPNEIRQFLLPVHSDF